mgnify:CR=1 FL=1
MFFLVRCLVVLEAQTIANKGIERDMTVNFTNRCYPLTSDREKIEQDIRTRINFPCGEK